MSELPHVSPLCLRQWWSPEPGRVSQCVSVWRDAAAAAAALRRRSAHRGDDRCRPGQGEEKRVLMIFRQS